MVLKVAIYSTCREGQRSSLSERLRTICGFAREHHDRNMPNLILLGHCKPKSLNLRSIPNRCFILEASAALTHFQSNMQCIFLSAAC